MEAAMTAEERIAELEHRLGVVEDELAIRRLQHAYGYYLDKCYYDEVVDLFIPVRFYWVRRARWLALHGRRLPGASADEG